MNANTERLLRRYFWPVGLTLFALALVWLAVIVLFLRT